jgi:HEAT repeat protein
MLDQAFESLEKYDWGPDRKLLQPIDEAVATAQGDSQGRRELENRLIEVLRKGVPRGSQDFICRKLMVIGTAASVPQLAQLLPYDDASHMARYALERIAAPEAAEALRTALPRVSARLKVGVIASLGVRRDAASVPLLARLVGDSDPQVATAAVAALGEMRTAGAADALKAAEPADAKVQRATVDAALACAEGLLAGGDKEAARSIYVRYAGSDQPKHIRLAATRGMLACAGGE